MELIILAIVWIASGLASCFLSWRGEYLIAYRFPRLGTPEEQMKEEEVARMAGFVVLFLAGPILIIPVVFAHLIFFNKQWHEETAAKRRAEGYDE